MDEESNLSGELAEDITPSRETAANDEVPCDFDLLRTFLSGRDVVCPLCDYNLRDLTSPTCPECGRAIQLTVGMVEPFLRLWIAMVIPLFAGAGIGALLLFLTAIFGFPPGDGAVLGFICPVGGIILTPVAIVSRRRFMRWSVTFQRIMAWLSWLGLIANFVLLFLFTFNR